MFETKKRAYLFMIISIMFALSAVILFSHYVKKTEASLGQLVEVQLARQDIPAGSPITAEMLETMQIPKKYLVDSFVQTKEEWSDKISLVPIPKGEILTDAMLRDASKTPNGYRLVQLRSPMAIFDDQLDVLDHVDLIGTYESKDKTEADSRKTEITFTDVEVIRVYKQEDQITSIGVALTLEQAEKVVWLMNFGKEVRVLKSNQVWKTGGKK